MKYIDVSQKIQLTKESGQEEIKQALLTRMRRAFKVDTLTEKDTGFHPDRYDWRAKGFGTSRAG